MSYNIHGRGRSVKILFEEGVQGYTRVLLSACPRRRCRLSRRNTSSAFVVEHKPYIYRLETWVLLLYYCTVIVIRTISGVDTADWTDRRPTNAGDVADLRCSVLASALPGGTPVCSLESRYQCIIIIIIIKSCYSILSTTAVQYVYRKRITQQSTVKGGRWRFVGRR